MFVCILSLLDKECVLHYNNGLLAGTFPLFSIVSFFIVAGLMNRSKNTTPQKRTLFDYFKTPKKSNGFVLILIRRISCFYTNRLLSHITVIIRFSFSHNRI